jgi:hypothetical protein
VSTACVKIPVGMVLAGLIALARSRRSYIGYIDTTSRGSEVKSGTFGRVRERILLSVPGAKGRRKRLARTRGSSSLCTFVHDHTPSNPLQQDHTYRIPATFLETTAIELLLLSFNSIPRPSTPPS